MLWDIIANMAITRPTGPAALLVLVSGALGSGKTTLAIEIAQALRLFHLHWDGIWDGLRFTAARGRGEPPAHGADVWYAAMALLLKSGVSLVADGTLYRGWDEANVRPLLGLGEVVNVHCRARGAIERYRIRHERDGASVAELAALVTRVETEQQRVIERLYLGCPCLEVDTTDGYEPSLAELIQTVRQTAAR